MRVLYSLIAISTLWACAPTQKPATEKVGTNLGVLQHDFQIADLARADFEKGLLLMHSFEYEDAREAFQAAMQADSSEIMTYWGEAMSYYKALWGLQDVDAGRAVMAKVGETEGERLSSITDELERGFWQGVELLYGEGEFKERNKKYTEHMARLYEKYPENQEVGAFYALGLVWSGEPGAESKDALLAGKIVEGIIAENPNHPGALHYKIHAFDNPHLAEGAKVAADLYAQVAPDAVHALHMPSHIYLALGLWDNVVSSNEASYAASVKKMARKNLKDGARGYHSFSWLHYGYLQQGRYEKAAGLLRDMLEYVPRDPTNGARSYLVSMQSSQLAETGDWDQALEPILDIKLDDLSIVSTAAHSLFRSRMALENGHPEKVEDEITDLIKKINIASTLVGEDGVAMCNAGPTRYAPDENALKVARTLLHQIHSLSAQAKGDISAFEQHLLTATQLENEADYPTGPPSIALPSFEQYGNWLLEQKRYVDALAQFDQSLERAPRRSQALKGKMLALKGLGKTMEANEINEELKLIWKDADPVALDLIAAR